MDHVIERELANGQAVIGTDKHGCLIVVLSTKTVLGDLHANIRLSPRNQVAGLRAGDRRLLALEARLSDAQSNLDQAVKIYNELINNLSIALPRDVADDLIPNAQLLASARLGNSFSEDTVVGAILRSPRIIPTFEAASKLLEAVPKPPIDDIYSSVETGRYSPKPLKSDAYVKYYASFTPNFLVQHIAGACCKECSIRKYYA